MFDKAPDEGQATRSAQPPNIATAPGDLPEAEVVARITSQRRQFRHDNTIRPLAPTPDQAVEVMATSGQDVGLDRAVVFFTTDGSQPDTTSSSIPLFPVTVEWDQRTGFLTPWHGEIPAHPEGTIVRYRIGGWFLPKSTGEPQQVNPDVWARDGQGFAFNAPVDFATTTFAYRVEPPGPTLPPWVQDAVIYQIFLDRFHPGTPDGAFPPGKTPHERHGGTLAGVRMALPYLVDLGVTCLWLSPLCASESYHRYDTTDFYTVDPMLGTNDDLRALTTEAHGRGIRVILDFVPSHCSWHHPAFLAAQQDQNAPSASWFTFYHWPDTYRSFLNIVRSLPSLNTDDPAAREHLIGSAVHWLRDCGVDGFRIDHAIGPGMDFWTALRAATRTVAPACFTVGEATDTPDSLRRYRGKLDGVLDFPLARSFWLTFGWGQWNVGEFDRFLTDYERYMHDGPGRVSFLDNHDMNRFLFVAGGNVARLKMAALCQFTLDAVPTIYYGTEIGLSQEHDTAERGFGGDAQVRQDFPWNQQAWNHDLLGFYRSLITLRRDHAVLRHGTRYTLYVNTEEGTYAYVRSASHQQRIFMPDAGDMLVAFNMSNETRTLSIPVQGDIHQIACLLSTGESPPVGFIEKKVSIILAPWAGATLGNRS